MSEFETKAPKQRNQHDNESQHTHTWSSSTNISFLVSFMTSLHKNWTRKATVAALPFPSVDGISSLCIRWLEKSISRPPLSRSSHVSERLWSCRERKSTYVNSTLIGRDLVAMLTGTRWRLWVESYIQIALIVRRESPMFAKKKMQILWWPRFSTTLFVCIKHFSRTSRLWKGFENHDRFILFRVVQSLVFVRVLIKSQNKQFQGLLEMIRQFL